MELDQAEIDRRVQGFTEACRRAGIKLTHQRIEIFREVARTDEHPDVETIFKRVRSRLPTISPDTVYRTLKTLEKLGVVSRVNYFCEPARFDANTSRHHHFVCVECGLMRDLSIPNAADLAIPEEAHEWGDVKSIHIELRSVCSACAKRQGGQD